MELVKETIDLNIIGAELIQMTIFLKKCLHCFKNPFVECGS